MNQPRKISPLRYFLAFCGSLDFHMEYLYPLRYLYDETLPQHPETMSGAVQIAVLIRKVSLNLPQFPQEQADLYRLCGEDVGKHLGLSLDAEKNFRQMSIKMLDMAMNHEKMEVIVKFAEDLAKDMGVNIQ